MSKREDWSAWRMGDETRVQVNRPDLAKTFAKEKTVRSAGYSVNGNYTRLYHIKQPVVWVEAWMKKFLRETKLN